MEDINVHLKTQVTNTWCCMEIPLTLLDIHRIASQKNICPGNINKQIIKESISDKSSLFKIRKKENGLCKYFIRGKCSINQIRPNACRIYALTQKSESEANPGISTGTKTNKHSILLEQIIATKITKLYINKYRTDFNKNYYQKAIDYIIKNIRANRIHKLKIGKYGENTFTKNKESGSSPALSEIYQDDFQINLVDILRVYKYFNFNSSHNSIKMDGARLF
jgi:Fe-S-cluster containining protein